MRYKHYIWMCILLLFASVNSSRVYAQFNPSNPAEPYIYYKVSVTAEPADVAYTSGTGQYISGKTVTINTSARNSSYVFQYWTVDGEVYSTERSFSYTVDNKDIKFVAHYKLSPPNPSEPFAKSMRRLYLEVEPSSAGSLSASSGQKVEVGKTVSLREYANAGYKFVGWYDGDSLLCSDQSFSYQMPDREVTLRAMFKYSPSNPGEPTKFYSTLIGDANNDNKLTAEDVLAVLDYMAGVQNVEFNEVCADANRDGKIDIADCTMILDLIEQKTK